MAITDSAAQLIGIENDNEFYSHHYLSEVFRGDIKDTLDRWSQASERPPYKRLQELATDYFKSRGRAAEARTAIERLGHQRGFTAALLHALDIEQAVRPLVLPDGTVLPCLAQLGPEGKAPTLVVLEVFQEQKPDLAAEEQPASLNQSPHPLQYHSYQPAAVPPVGRFDELISGALLAQDHPPRRVLLLDHHQAVLIDRFKWSANRVLRFQFNEILGRRDDATLKASAALLHRDSLCPREGNSLLDHLDENAHRHAYQVSEDLKHALREAVELLGNEALAALRARGQNPFEEGLDPNDFSKECLRYMYRLLFLFYIEARPELEYVPLKSKTYLAGYSLESLRDLELVHLDDGESRDGLYFHKSLQRLFHLIFHGYAGAAAHSSIVGAFKIAPLDSHLFDPKLTPTLTNLPLRNQVLQGIIRLMSLTREQGGAGKGKGKRRGRVSYAQLGINQLGEVYEALLSYRGFFAREDLYEVKQAGSEINMLETGYFVNRHDLEAYTEAERVYERDELGRKRLKLHPQGSFIYRMAGRDRQKSASYYTPEVLTKCLVKYSLKELLKDRDDGSPYPADEILRLTICEPAMGSAAFLNEAVNQLAEAYLERKQHELGRRIAHEDYGRELQKLKMHIADHNCFGVDLNPVAVELAEVSLWLNAIHGTDQVPWFGYQLFAGNSLVGARRQVYDSSQLKIAAKGTKEDLWYHHAPQRLDPAGLDPERANGLGLRRKDQVYHFLLPDPGMANYNDKVVKQLKPEAIKAIDSWRKSFCEPLEKTEIKTLQQISAVIDQLWARHVAQLRADRNYTEDPQPVWPNQAEGEASRQRTSTREKDQRRAEGLFNFERPFASPMMQLKMVMDYWCSLWFWPIEQAQLLPDRTTYLHHIATILQGERKHFELQQIQESLFFETERNPLDVKAEELREQGQVRVERIHSFYPQLKLVDELAKNYRFHHWELYFADIFADRGGFDLILGNPPWLKVIWEEGGIMGEENPILVLHKLSAKELGDKRKETLARSGMDGYLAEYEACSGTQAFLNGMQNYPLLKGVQTNLYKCFLPQAWMVGAARGVSGFVHPEGIYDDPNGGTFRKTIYQHLRHHYHFLNKKKLFKEIKDEITYSLNVYEKGRTEVLVYSMANLFLPQTIDDSWAHDGTGPVPGIKNEQSQWDFRGHRSRIFTVDRESLTLFAKLYDKEGVNWKEARLPALHSSSLLVTIKRMANTKKKIGNMTTEIFPSEFMHETNAQRDGTLRRETEFPENEKGLVVSGPYFFVANPFYKTPRRVCIQNSHYDSLDLMSLPQNYIQRSNFFVSCSEAEFRSRAPVVSWDDQNPVIDYYRLAFRRLLYIIGERTLIPCILPKEASHIDAAFSLTFKDEKLMVLIAAHVSSLPYDFFVKSTGKATFRYNLASQLALVDDQALYPLLKARILVLNCLSNAYAELWSNCFEESFKACQWTKNSNQLDSSFFSHLKPEWDLGFSLRSPFERRQALVEIDVLVAIGLGMELGELIAIYLVQFYLLQQYEAETFYDQKGRIVFTINNGLLGVGLNRKPKKDEPPCTVTWPDGSVAEGPKGWEDVQDLPAGATVSQTVEDDTLPGGPRPKTITYHAPFFRCDREEDYRIAWAEFTRRFAVKENENK